MKRVITKSKYPETPCLTEWKEGLLSAKGHRYLRDNFRIIERDAWQYSAQTLNDACAKCNELGIYNAHRIMEVAESLRAIKKRTSQTAPCGSYCLHKIGFAPRI